MIDIVDQAKGRLTHTSMKDDLHRLIAGLVYEVERLRAAQQWQPIETAPSGEPVRVYGQWEGDEFQSEGVAMRPIGNSLWFSQCCDVYTVMCQPTHWKPLDLPPATGEVEP